jgi:hypothetical protein
MRGIGGIEVVGDLEFHIKFGVARRNTGQWGLGWRRAASSAAQDKGRLGYSIPRGRGKRREFNDMRYFERADCKDELRK